jgi:hypothetical protein
VSPKTIWTAMEATLTRLKGRNSSYCRGDTDCGPRAVDRGTSGEERATGCGSREDGSQGDAAAKGRARARDARAE